MKNLIPYSLVLLLILTLRSPSALASMSSRQSSFVKIEAGFPELTLHFSQSALAEPASMMDREEDDEADNRRRRSIRRGNHCVSPNFTGVFRQLYFHPVSPGSRIQAQTPHPLLWQGALRI